MEKFLHAFNIMRTVGFLQATLVQYGLTASFSAVYTATSLTGSYFIMNVNRLRIPLLHKC